MRPKTRPGQAKARRDCFEAHKRSDPDTGRIYLDCHICGGRIDPAREAWEADHVVRYSVGGSDDVSNVMPAHKKCHRSKTDDDVRENAKGKRVWEKYYGIR